MAYGVIGNTTGFGPVILGSSPSRPTEARLYVGLFLFWLLRFLKKGRVQSHLTE